MKKAKELNTKQISEDDFLEMIRKSQGDEMEIENSESEEIVDEPNQKSKKVKTPEKKTPEKLNSVKKEVKDDQFQLWTDKYKPNSMKDFVGNASNVKIIVDWLKSWKTEYNKNIGVKKPTWKKAIIVSGKPGIGKTSSSKIICKDLGFDLIEMNASDTRNKKSLQSKVAELATNQSLIQKKTCLVMDEVDGMSAGDRGGITELIQIIKNSKIPIICICNDRYKQVRLHFNSKKRV
jgi:replication factor C subunit 1